MIGFGPVIGAPISETLGRKYVYLISMPLFLLFTMGAGLAENFGTLLVCRFFSALLGAPVVAVGVSLQQSHFLFCSIVALNSDALLDSVTL